MIWQKTHTRRKLAGLCYTCGGALDDDTKSRCAGCRNKQLVSARAIRQDRLARGLCRKCGGALDDNRSLGLLGECPDRIRALADYIERVSK